MVRNKDADGIKSSLIVSEVEKRPCLYDSNHQNYGDRAEKAKCWSEVNSAVVPGWSALGLAERTTAGKEVQKRWRSIRDSYTKAFRQGKCATVEQCAPGSHRYRHHRQMAFLLRALQNKKPRYSSDKYESFSEISNSPQHPAPEELRIKTETVEKTDKPEDKLDKAIDKPEVAIEKPEKLRTEPVKPETMDKSSQVAIANEKSNASLEIKIDANSILPDDHFDDDKSFMNSIIPLFKKMTDDSRLLCRIEFLKIIRFALQGSKVEAMTPAGKIGNGMPEITDSVNKGAESNLSMTTRSADGSRPVRKRKMRSPSPLPLPPTKKRGPGRPRKVRPPRSDSEEEPIKKRTPKLRVTPVSPMTPVSRLSAEITATRVDQLSAPQFMKVYNLERSKTPQNLLMQIPVKSEPIDPDLQ